MEDNKKDSSQTKIISAAMTLLAVLIIVSAILSYINDKNSNNNTNQEANISSSGSEKQVAVRQMDIGKLRGMGERDRMNYYFSYFVDLVENKSYRAAYDLLNEEFKENFFETLEEFTEYAKKTFPKMANLNYTNIERNGEIYVLWVEITDVLNGRKDEKVEINVVIKEKDFAEIEMSFTVI